MPVRYYKYDRPFVLENVERLPELQIAYHTYGKFKGNNVIWEIGRASCRERG